MFRPKSSVTSLAGRSTPLGAKDRKNLRQQFLSQFKRKTKEDFDEVCPAAGVLAVFSVKGVTCDIYVCDSVPIFITHSSKKKSAALIPTVFTLWKIPDLLPRMVCHEPAIGFISRGADFMIPGCVNRKAIAHYTETGEYPDSQSPSVVILPKQSTEDEDTSEAAEVTDSTKKPTEPVEPKDAVEENSESCVQPEKATDKDEEATVGEGGETEPFRYPLAALEEGQIWSLGCLGHRAPFAVGEVAMNIDEFINAEKGKLLIITHVIGDLLYKMCPGNKYTIPAGLKLINEPSLDALLSCDPSMPSAGSEPSGSQQPTAAPTPAPPVKSKTPVTVKPLKQISAYQPLNNVKEIFQSYLGLTIKPMMLKTQLEELIGQLMAAAYAKSLNYPTLPKGDDDASAAPPPTPVEALPPFVEIVLADQTLTPLFLIKKDRLALKEPNPPEITNQKIIQTFLTHAFKKLTILAPEDSKDLSTGCVVIEGDALITISVKKTKRFIRTQVSNIHKFSNIEPKQLAERLQRACAASASVAEMDDLKGNPLGVLVQGTVPHECAKLIHTQYGIPLDMILIS